MTDQDIARAAAVESALELAMGAAAIALGSGRAVFALTRRLGETLPGATVVTASEKTALLAIDAGLRVVAINDLDSVDIAFDGADEIDPHLRLIKGAGAALLREKLVFALSKRVVILAEDNKLVERLGSFRSLPVEIVPFAWSHTLDRLIDLCGEALLWTNEDGEPFVTDNGNHLADVSVPPDVDLVEFASNLKSSLGVIEHGLFLDQATEALIGTASGSVKRIDR